MMLYRNLWSALSKRTIPPLTENLFLFAIIFYWEEHSHQKVMHPKANLPAELTACALTEPFNKTSLQRIDFCRFIDCLYKISPEVTFVLWNSQLEKGGDFILDITEFWEKNLENTFFFLIL